MEVESWFDEVSITGPTNLWNVQGGHVHHAIIERVHQPGLTHDRLPGGDDDDCTGGNTHRRCRYQGELGHWACAAMQCPVG